MNAAVLIGLSSCAAMMMPASPSTGFTLLVTRPVRRPPDEARRAALSGDRLRHSCHALGVEAGVLFFLQQTLRVGVWLAWQEGGGGQKAASHGVGLRGVRVRWPMLRGALLDLLSEQPVHAARMCVLQACGRDADLRTERSPENSQTWIDFSKCMAEGSSPQACAGLREDYLECLHHRKEARAWLQQRAVDFALFGGKASPIPRALDPDFLHLWARTVLATRALAVPELA